MRELPIIFNTEMVKAILDGRKTQTRRVFKQLDSFKISEFDADTYSLSAGFNKSCRGLLATNSGMYPSKESALHHFAQKFSPYGSIDDLLYVRETFQIESNYGFQDVYTKPDKPLGPVRYFYFQPGGQDPEYFQCPRYKASEPDTELCIASDDGEGMRWKPSIHMPKWAARIWLKVTNVRVERVQDISNQDSIAEGIEYDTQSDTKLRRCRNYLNPETHFKSPVDSFASLWDSINKSRGYGWEVNPWVWVVEFERIEK